MNNWDETYIKIADEYAKHSKCAARKVACVLVKDNNIIGVGVNGTLSGKTNCCDKFYRDWKLNDKKEWKNKIETYIKLAKKIFKKNIILEIYNSNGKEVSLNKLINFSNNGKFIISYGKH